MIAESAVLAPRLDPFPGLRPFTDQEAHLFFGRDGQSNEIVRLLETAGFATVVGTSGCGKSSLVRAGLLPTLWAGYASRAGSRWRVADLKPGSHPLANLAGALHQAGIAESVDAAALRSSSLALVSAVRRAREAGRLEPEENLLLLVDQFEELFPEESHERSAENTVADRDERAQFVALLLEAVRRREQRIFVVLTLRAEFLGECTRFRDLPETINCSQYLVPRMTRQQRHAAITGPVRVAGAEIAPRLVQRLLNELGDDPDALPVLQHTLLRTWNRWVENGPSSRPIDWADYESIGTLRDALDHHADEVLAEAGLRLGQGGETLVRRIFQRLRWRDDRGRERRSPAAIRELCAVAEADLEQVRTVVDCFRDDAAGRTFLTPFKSQVTEVSPETEIDITHESLLRRWTSLRDDWVQEEEESKRIYTDLAQRTEETRGGEDLLRGSLLERTFEWWQSRQPNAAWATRYRSNFAAARSYLFASWERYRRERILRRVAALLAVIGMCGLAAALNSFLTVRAAHRTAVVHLLAAKAALAVAGESTGIEMGLLLAVESLRRFPTPEAQAAANRALSLLPLRLASQPTPHARQVGFSAHGSLLTLLDEVGGLHFRSTAGQVRDVAGEPLPPLASFALARDATVLAAAGQGGTVFVVDATKRRKMAQFDCTPSPPIAISGNGRVVAAVCGRELRIWRAEAPRTETRLLPVKRREGAAEEKENWTQAALDYPGDIVV